jgi:hypothetical protein
LPKQIQRKDLFAYIEKELKDWKQHWLRQGPMNMAVLIVQLPGHYLQECI